MRVGRKAIFPPLGECRVKRKELRSFHPFPCSLFSLHLALIFLTCSCTTSGGQREMNQRAAKRTTAKSSSIPKKGKSRSGRKSMGSSTYRAAPTTIALARSGTRRQENRRQQSL